MNLGTIFDALQPQTNQAAAQAANAALTEAAARPFKVDISLDQATRDWAMVALVAWLVGSALVRRL